MSAENLHDRVLGKLYVRLPALHEKDPDFVAEFLLNAIDKIPQSSLLKLISDSLEEMLAERAQ